MKCIFFLFSLMVSMVPSGFALTFEIKKGSDVVGALQKITPKPGDSLFDVSRRYDIGYVELIEANPSLMPTQKLDSNVLVVIPSQFILPSVPREGIVINLAELRLYYYHPDKLHVTTVPVGIGREGWNTPLGASKIVSKVKDPVWHPTDNIRREAQKEGITIPEKVLAGPENPLGRFAMRLNWREYLIHGTNRPEGVGRRSSAGCIRLFPEDIEFLFSKVVVGEKVTIVNEPFKSGWLQDALYLEAHVPLQEDIHSAKNLEVLVQKIYEKFGQEALIQWSLTQLELTKTTGIPFKIGSKIKAPQQQVR